MKLEADTRSLDRPAWTSEPDTGSLNAFKHKHRVSKNVESPVLPYYYKKSKGLE